MGDYLAFTVNHEIAGLALVAGGSYVSTDIVWDNDLYPYRMPIEFVHAMEISNRLPVSAGTQKHIQGSLGTQIWVRNSPPTTSEDANAEYLVDLVLSRQNDLPAIEAGIDARLAVAKGKKKEGKIAPLFLRHGSNRRKLAASFSAASQALSHN